MSITQPKTISIKEIVDEAPNYKTFIFDYDLKAKPGQYVMFWLPGVDLKPYSVCWQTNEQFALTVLKRGNFTTKLFECKVGDLLGFTGPHGTFYNLDKKRKILLIGAGCGAPSIIFLSQEAKKKNIAMDFILGARTKDELIFEDWLTKQGVIVYHRFQNNKYEHVWDLIKDKIDQEKYDGIYACGPELLLKKIVDYSLEKKIFCQISMERYMKCGIGVCGKCCVDPFGFCLCTSGPVVNAALASQITEFGKYYRDSSGQKVYFNK